MLETRTTPWLVAAVFALTACAQPTDLPLVFGESNTLGISVATSPAEQGIDLTLGYKSRDIAIIPVVLRQEDGSGSMITARDPKYSDGAGLEDAFSVFGQFEAETEATTDKTQPRVGANLGRFFATGLAAVALSEGFACKLSYEGAADIAAQDQGITGWPTPDPCSASASTEGE